MFNNSPMQWLNHQYVCYYNLKFKHACMQKAEMNHQRQLCVQMVSNSCVISGGLLASILTIIIHVV